MSGSPGGMGMGPTGEGEPPCTACAQGQLSGDTWAKGRRHGHIQNLALGERSPSAELGISYVEPTPGTG